MNGSNGCVITGANGFLGREIVSQIRAAGLLLRGTDVQPTCYEPGIPYQQADITVPDQLPLALEGASSVVHASGLAHVFSPEAGAAGKYREINEIGTANVVSAAVGAGAEHIVLISSVSVYGPGTRGHCGENDLCNPSGAYAESKRKAELKAREIALDAGVPLTILRLATLYGEGDPGNIGRLLKALDERLFLWIGEGRNRKSLLYKGDAARACLSVLNRPAAGVRVYNVSGPPYMMRDIVDGLVKALGKSPFFIRIPEPTAMAAGRFLSRLPAKRLSQLRLTMEKWLAEDVYDTSSFERDYGYHTKVDLSEGFTREVRWYLQGK